MKNICFIWDDNKFNGLDLSNPQQGNPGVGGTDFLFAAVPFELAKRNLFSVSIIHSNPSNVLPLNVNSYIVDKSYEITDWENIQQPDIIVIRAGAHLRRVKPWIPPRIPIIAWAHNHLRKPDLDWLAKESQVAAIVNVGLEQLLLTSRSSCYHKSTVVFNGIYSDNNRYDKYVREKRAVYLGALIPSKGFHRLARVWPQILSKVPDAFLDVIGSGDVYGGNPKLGPMGIALDSYEKLITSQLGSSPESLNVIFRGKMGSEKQVIMEKCTVGLPNPIGFTECLSLSALELASAGNVIVAPWRWGLCDSVDQGVTGYLCEGDKAYINIIVNLLNNPILTKKMGTSAQEWIRDNFNYDVICSQWENVVMNVFKNGKMSGCQSGIPKGKYPYKWLFILPKIPNLSQAIIDHIDKIYGWYLRR